MAIEPERNLLYEVRLPNGVSVQVKSKRELGNSDIRTLVKKLVDSDQFTPKKSPGKPDEAETGSEKDILDFIGKHESRGDYNAYWNDKRWGEKVDFTSMTVNDVLRWQDDYVARQRAAGKSFVSSAVGKYQFIRKTLRGLVSEMNLNGDEMFDERLQDKLGVALLKRRGLDDFKKGKISAERFGTNLAKEWASLPVLEGVKYGKSYYGSDGVNKAGVDPDKFFSVLENFSA